MPGTIVAKGDRTYLVRVFLRRDSNGKQVFHNHTVHGTKKDAQAYLNAVLRERDLGTFVEPGNVTLGEYLDRWLADAAKPRVREHTFRDYTTLLARYVRPALGDRRLRDLTPLDVQGLCAGMLERGLSARTVRYTHAVLRQALGQAVKWGMLARNVATLVGLPRQERREMRALSREEAKRFLAAAQDDRWGVLFAFALATGMRPGEYLALRWEDVDLRAGTARVTRVLVRGKDGYRFEEPKTPKSRRTVPLPASTTKALEAHKACQAEARLRAGGRWQDLGLVFAGDDGQPLDAHNLVARHFKPVLRAAGLPPSVRLYDLRHTCATLLLQAGVNPKVVAERLGHAGGGRRPAGGRAVRRRVRWPPHRENCCTIVALSRTPLGIPPGGVLGIPCAS
jgi:integrase